MRRRLLRGTSIAALVATAMLSASSPTRAEKVGVAAAVKPDAFSSLSGGAKSQLNIGKSIFYKERINTTGSGLVQVLLVDGSTFTVGPGSDLVIDKFVYDPKKKQGEIVASFSKGVMRFVGGKISKNDDGVTVKTPAGSLAIRGGIFQALVNGPKGVFSFLYGDEMKLTSLSGREYVAFQPGYVIDTTSGLPRIREGTPADTNAVMMALTRGGGGTGNSESSSGTQGNQEAAGALQQANNESESLDQLISDANATQIQGEIQKELASLTDNAPDQQQQSTASLDTVTINEIPAATELPTPPTSGPPPDNEPPVTEYNGYAAALVVSDRPVSFNNVVASQSPEDFVLQLDSSSADVVLYDVEGTDGATSRYAFGFAPVGPESTVTASVFDEGGVAYTQTSATGHIIDGDEAGLTRLFPDTFGENEPAPRLCLQCDFMKWGALSTQVTFSNPDGENTTTYVDVITGWWVAGSLTSPVQIDALAAQNATASYSGHVVGNVARQNDNWQFYPAAGDLSMNWEFAQRKGELTISNFDGRSFGTGPQGLTQLGRLNQFGGDLSGDGLVGKTTGSFARGPLSPAQGVIGNWHLGGDGYRATGIFAGSGMPRAGN